MQLHPLGLCTVDNLAPGRPVLQRVMKAQAELMRQCKILGLPDSCGNRCKILMQAECPHTGVELPAESISQQLCP